MKISNFRLLLTLVLCLACIGISYYRYSRSQFISQTAMRKIHAQWQNQQINQYLSHRILLSVHREPLALSQWNPDVNQSKTFCDAIRSAMVWPSEWTSLSNFNEQWLKRFALTKWFNSEKNLPHELIELIKSAKVKIDSLPNENNSLCTVRISTRVKSSESLSTLLNFSGKKRESL